MYFTKDHIVDILKEKGGYHIYASRFHVNIINKSVAKERAIKKLFNIENLDYNILYTIGDNENDYGMLKEFNGGIIKKHHKNCGVCQKAEHEAHQKDHTPCTCNACHQKKLKSKKIKELM